MKNKSNLEFFQDVGSFIDSEEQKEALTRKEIECIGKIAAERHNTSLLNGKERERERERERETETETERETDRENFLGIRKKEIRWLSKRKTNK